MCRWLCLSRRLYPGRRDRRRPWQWPSIRRLEAVFMALRGYCDRVLVPSGRGLHLKRLARLQRPLRLVPPAVRPQGGRRVDDDRRPIVVGRGVRDAHVAPAPVHIAEEEPD